MKNEKRMRRTPQRKGALRMRRKSDCGVGG